MSRVKRTFFSILLAIVLAAGFGLTVNTPAGAATTLYVSKWTEYASTPVFDPAERAYYPTILFDGATYQMWYADGTGIRYTTSSDGITWAAGVSVTGLTNAHHPLVKYTGSQYIIWYWDTSQLYSINAIRYAESGDGTTWVNNQAITGNIITGIDGDWNKGSYGPIDAFYNPTATNTGTNPFDYSFAMYFDGTTGSFEEIGLGYSPDGKSWTLYGKVLPRGGGSAWDSSYTTFGTVIKDADGKWHMWYSGGQADSNDGIGYAYSTDGLNWTKDTNNPIMHQNDGVAWRAERTYTPRVIEDGGIYKMWFSGMAGGNYALGYATADGPFPSIQPAISVASAGDTIIVAAGTYLGGIQIDKALTLESTGGAAVTTIKGVASNDSYLVRIYHSDVTLDGFTVTNPDYSGGADASGILVGDYLGYGGVSNVQILNNIVTQVRSESGSPSMYGATGINIGRSPVGDLVISGNTITSIHNPDGAPVDHTCGINIWDGADNVLISGNKISDIKYNGILLQYVSNIQLVNNLLTQCQTGLKLEPYTGAAVSNATVTNCTFSNNSGGMYNLDSSPVVTNCIFWDGGSEIANNGTSAPVVTYCDVQGGYSGEGNIDADPLFVGGGDYHLQASSPCIDTGSNSAPSLPGTDFEGDPRIIDGDGNGLAVVDMGVDEYLPPPSPPVITLHPADQNITYGSSATFTAAANGVPAPTVQWQVDNGGGWADIPGETNTTLIVATPPLSYSGYQYHAVFTNSEDEAITNAATLTVTGGGGGGGGGSAPPTTLSEVGSVRLLQYLDGQGRTRIKIILKSDDNVFTITIFSDTLVNNVEGNPLESLGIVTLSTPPPPPGYVLVGHAYDCLPDGVHFSPNVTMTFAYDEANIPHGVNEQDLVLAYWDGNKWINLLTSINTAANTATTDSGHFTPFALLAYTGLANFSVSNLAINPPEVAPNNVVNITLSVANIGDTEGSYNAVLKINGAKEAEQSVTLAAGKSQSVSFSVTRAEAGSYNVTVEGLSGSFAVVAPAINLGGPPPEAKPPINWMWIGIIAAVVAVGLAIFFAVRQRSRRRSRIMPQPNPPE